MYKRIYPYSWMCPLMLKARYLYADLFSREAMKKSFRITTKRIEAQSSMMVQHLYECTLMCQRGIYVAEVCRRGGGKMRDVARNLDGAGSWMALGTTAEARVYSVGPGETFKPSREVITSVFNKDDAGNRCMSWIRER